MAKYCDVCKQPYPDDQPFCPHCAAAAPGGAKHGPGGSEPEIELGSQSTATTPDSGIVLTGPGVASGGEFEAVEGSSFDIDLDRPAATQGEDSGVVLEGSEISGPSSDVVDLDWSALVEDEAAPARPDEPEVVEAVEATAPATAQEPPAPAESAAAAETEQAPEAHGTEPPHQRPSKETKIAPRAKPETMLAKDEEPEIMTAEAADEDPSAVDLLHQPPVAGESDSGVVRLAEPADQGPPELEEPADSSAVAMAGKDHEEVVTGEDSSAALDDAGRGGRAPSVSSLEIDEAAMAAPQPRRPAEEPSSDTLARQLLGEDDSSSGVDLSAGGEEEAAGDVATAESRSDLDLGSADGETATVDQAAEAGAEEEAATRAEEAAEGEAEEAREKAVKQRGRATPWVGGGVAGLVVGSAACLALWAFGVEPPQSLRVVKSKEPAKSAAPAPQDTGTQARPANKEAEPTAGDRFWTMLGQRKPGQGPVKDSDPAVQEAMKELGSAQDADAFFNRGLMQESLGEIAKAHATYEEGLKKFKDAPDQRRFEAALDRLDSRTEAEQPAANKPAGKSTSARPLPHDRQRFAAAVAGLLLPGLAADAPQPAAGAEADEAGFDFWKALKLANRQHNYSAAIDELKKARAIHEQQRFLRRNKAQNPASDPTGEIFLRCADELAAYWALRARLSELTKQQDPAKALDKMLTDAKTTQVKLEAVAAELKKDKAVTAADPDLQNIGSDVQMVLKTKNQAVEQLAGVGSALEKAKVVKAGDKDPAAGVQKLLKDSKQAMESLAAARDVLKRAKVGGTDGGVAGGIEKLLAAQKATDKRLATATAQLQEERDTVKAVRVRLTAAKVLSAGAGRAQLLGAVDSLVSQSPDRIEVIRVKRLLAQAHTPAQMLDVWVSLLRGGGHKELAREAAADARRVLEDRGADAPRQAEARLVAGLALWSQGQLVDARHQLEQALNAPAARGAAWRQAGEAAVKDLSDPDASFLPRAEELWAGGQPEQALVLLNTALEAFSDKTPERGRVLARRSLVQLGMARARARPGDRGETDVNMPFAPARVKPLRAEAVAAAEKDAKAAVAAGAMAEGHYAMGQIAEALGKWADAAQHYRETLKAAGTPVRDRNRYRLALAQVLIRMMDDKRPADRDRKPAAEDETKTGRAPAPRPAALSRAAAAVAILLAGADGDQPPASDDQLADARGLAEEAIRQGDPEGHLVLAQVLAREDRWTVALMEYIEGMRQLTRPPEIAQGLRSLVAQHPAFKLPDSVKPPQPLLAEQHYSDGLRLYWDRRYPEAAKEFTEALRYSGNDARYDYFLGLVWLQQGQRSEALEAFRQGGLLERQGLPDHGTVNTALERVQGASRRLIEDSRP